MPNEDVDVLELDEGPPVLEADDGRGRAVLEAWAPRLAAQAESTTFTGLAGGWVGFAVRKGLATLRAEPGLEARLRRIPAEFYDISTLDDLEPGGLALEALSRDLADARVGQGRAKVPVDLSDRAGNHKRRLVRMAEWEAMGDAQFEAFVVDVRRGRGIMDTIDDLSRLGFAIKKRQAVFEKNRLYRPDDAEVAHRLAAELTAALLAELSPEARALRSTQLRLYAILERAWRHTVRAVNLLRADEAELLSPTLRSQVLAVRG